MTRTLFRKPVVLAIVASFVGLTALSQPSLAFNPQPDPPGRVRIHSPPSELLFLQNTGKPAVLAAKPDCKSRKGKTNPCN